MIVKLHIVVYKSGGWPRAEDCLDSMSVAQAPLFRLPFGHAAQPGTREHYSNLNRNVSCPEFSTCNLLSLYKIDVIRYVTCANLNVRTNAYSYV